MQQNKCEKYETPYRATSGAKFLHPNIQIMNALMRRKKKQMTITNLLYGKSEEEQKKSMKKVN